MFCEIKSNMRREHLEAIFKSGMTDVQPGIENLSANVLKIMDKGVTGCLTSGCSVRQDRLGSCVVELSLWLSRRRRSRLQPIIAQFPALHHLPPPGGATRIAIERLSPYFDNPELGFADIKPARMYSIIYDLPESELRDLAYIFDAPALGVTDAVTEIWIRRFRNGGKPITKADPA